ncbi:MAG: Pr6Pr family membrane protein [Gemmatimonadales bacterium]
MSRSRLETSFLTVAGLLAWAGVLIQLWVSTRLFGNPLTASWRLLGYFTILTNVIVAVFFTARLLHREGPANHWARSDSFATWVTVSITFVGLGFIVLLARLYHFEGIEWLTNALLHYVTPTLGLLYWLLFVRPASLRWKDPMIWSVYVLAYGIYSMARGAVDGFYPYPFVDLPKIGWARVSINMIGLYIAFCLFGALFVAIGRWWPCDARAQSTK